MGFVDAPIMMALEKGYFREQNLDVQIEPIAGAADVVAFLGTGELDLAHGGIPPGPVQCPGTRRGRPRDRPDEHPHPWRTARRRC